MTAVPAWPGVTEYLYHAASSALVASDGTAMVPFGLRPRRSRLDWTPIAGMATETGRDLRSDGLFTAAGLIVPAAEVAGAGACCWESRAMPMNTAPPRSSTTPARPASLMRARPRGGGAGANWLSGHDMTTRSPPMRGPLPNAVPFRCLPEGVLHA